eukprot:Blabericola_migrator_1__564@NODE_113_length_13881_cov_115_766396_g101_i0_p2_GENE_NODE_113_length_13881_cov_115_766396_g101_i0NODE_113_length_13881_cov_115_766396_g101_i0_p2_ORF_typecomplete_len1176_score272_61TACC_C/PF05010_14/0_0069TACC_C/PF05010_14/4e03TACC_C/PF05010_14/1_8e04TACC_C/PF05010_14/1_8e04HOOK/PF05622_12/0_055HOOK/PF05622_12/1_6Myosin_tail_1/PF01576_19/66Myosin_tail_1/PF01576_19/0_0041MAD/PF05557_13/0_0045MAD/PF05557_13/2_9e02AAA_13/PF13166_6/11AAA_13/PF13166_6/0_23AAA_13/PF13166_6/
MDSASPCLRDSLLMGSSDSAFETPYDQSSFSNGFLLSISSAPEKTSCVARRPLRDMRAHETGFFDTSSRALSGQSALLSLKDESGFEDSSGGTPATVTGMIVGSNAECAQLQDIEAPHSECVPGDTDETSHQEHSSPDQSDDLDLLLHLKLSEPAPSQEVSVLSWTLSADTPNDELLMDNEDQPTWVPSLEGSTGARTPADIKAVSPSPPLQQPADAENTRFSDNRSTPASKGSPPSNWEVPSPEAAMASLPFLSNDTKKPDPHSATPCHHAATPTAEETFAWLQVCLNYRGTDPALGLQEKSKEVSFDAYDDSATIPDEFNIGDHDFITLPLSLEQPLMLCKDRYFGTGDKTSQPTHHSIQCNSSTVATTSSLDFNAPNTVSPTFKSIVSEEDGMVTPPRGGATQSPNTSVADTGDMRKSSDEAPPPPPPTVQLPPARQRSRVMSMEASPTSEMCRRSGMALFSRPPMGGSGRSTDTPMSSRRGRSKHSSKAPTPRSRKASRSVKERTDDTPVTTSPHNPFELTNGPFGGQRRSSSIARHSTATPAARTDPKPRRGSTASSSTAGGGDAVLSPVSDNRTTKHLLYELLRRLDSPPVRRPLFDETGDSGNPLHPQSSRRPRLATVAGRFYRSQPGTGRALFEDRCCDRSLGHLDHSFGLSEEMTDADVEALIRSVCQEADAQVSAALEERDAVLRETAAEHQRFLRAIKKLEVALQEKELETMRLSSEAAEERRRLKSKCEQLEEALEKWERSFDRLKSHASERESQLANDLRLLKENGMSKDSEIAKLNAEIIRRAHEFTSLQKTLHETRENDSKELAEVKRQHDDQLRVMRKKHEEEMSVLDQHWTSVVSNLNQMISDMKEKSDTKVAELQDTIDKQNSELVTLRAASSTDKKKLQTVESEWKVKLNEKDVEIGKLKEDREELVSSLHKLKKAHDQLKKRNVSQDDYMVLKEKNDESMEIINDLKNVITSANDEKEDLKSQANRAASRAAQMEKALMEKEVALTIKGKMIEEQSLYMSKMREKLQAYEEEIIELKAQKKRQMEDMHKAMEEQQKAAQQSQPQPNPPPPSFELRAENENLRRDLQEKIACLDLVAREIEDLRKARCEEQQKMIEQIESERTKSEKAEAEATEIKKQLELKASEIDQLTMELQRVRSLASDKLTQIALELAGGKS